jgi:peptide/nickel transport system permease protein
VIRLIVYRLVWSILLLFVVSAMVFVLVSLTPGSIASEILGQNAATPQAIAELNAKLGLDKPFWEQYLNWLGGAIHGDLGTSYFTGEPVVQMLNSRIGATLSLMTGTIIVITAVGILFGVISALRKNSGGGVVDVVSLLAYSLPDFWVALLLIALFAVSLRLLPAVGFVPIGTSAGQWAYFLVLPVSALALNGVARIAKQSRAAMTATLGRDYVRVLLANGFSRRSVIFKHALRNAAIPIVSSIGIAFIGLTGGTVVVEKIFAIPGIGSLAVQATGQHDLPVVVGASLYFTMIVVVVNFIVDLAYGWINPRARATS